MQFDNLWLMFVIDNLLYGYLWKFKKPKWFLSMHTCLFSLSAASVSRKPIPINISPTNNN